MLRNRPTATLAASGQYSQLTPTAPTWLTSASGGETATTTAPTTTTTATSATTATTATTATVSSGLPQTGSDLPLEALIATGLLAGGALLRLRRSAVRA